MAKNVKRFLDRMQDLRNRMNRVDPRQVFMIEKMRLLKEHQLMVDDLNQPSLSYCQQWLDDRKFADSKVK